MHDSSFKTRDCLINDHWEASKSIQSAEIAIICSQASLVDFGSYLDFFLQEKFNLSFNLKI